VPGVITGTAYASLFAHWIALAAVEGDTMMVGTTARLLVSFTDQTVTPPVLTDPTDVTLRIKPLLPLLGPVQVYLYSLAQLAKDGVGLYHFDLVLHLAGQYAVRWEGSGAVVATSLDLLLRADPSVVVGPSA
jgi:hypothetical protein